MAIFVKNNSTNEVVRISGVKVVNGVIVPKKNDLGKKFITSHSAELTLVLDENGGQTFTVNDGFSLAKSNGASKPTDIAEKPSKKRTSKKKVAKAEATVDVTTEPTKETATETVAETVADEIEAIDTTADENENEQALIAAIKNLRGGAVDLTKVRAIVREEIEKLAADEPKKAVKAMKAIAKTMAKVDEVHCEKYERIKAKVSRGRRVYLYGPAGSGKSHTAEQIARDLGLNFYGQTTIQFAHDVRGYGDAAGNFQDTPFFKAFSGGGLYFQDEYDRSNAEAAIVLNSALANGWYDFPIIGRVEVHPDFRFMAAGNTLMKGADDGYITGQEIDPSSRDRFDFYFEIGYLRDVELRIAHGNEEIVNFVEDVRQSIKYCGIEHVVSYRATAAMTDEVENENDLQACCVEGVFKGLDIDARREIWNRLNDKENRWAKALKKTL